MPTKSSTSWTITTLEDIKALDITTLDVRHLTQITDTMIICSGSSSIHIKAIANRLIEAAKQHQNPPIGIEGFEQKEWILVDLNDTVVHIMLPQTRELYDLEKLWDFTKESRQHHED